MMVYENIFLSNEIRKGLVVDTEKEIDEAGRLLKMVHMGYIKRTPSYEFRTQSRGGIGSKGSDTREEDFIEHMFNATMHNTLLLFTKKGKCFWLKVYEIPEGSKNSRGRAIQNLIQIEPDDKIEAYVNVKTLDDNEYIKNNYIVICTEKGIIKKTTLEEYSNPRQKGITAINIKEGDQLLQACLTDGKNEIIIGTKLGKAVRFNESDVRPMGRNSMGVIGVNLSEDDKVIGMVCVDKNEEKETTILVVSEKGYGKRSSLEDYRITKRGAKGIKTMNITEKTGNLVCIRGVKDDQDIMIITKMAMTIRVAVSDIRVLSRATQGVKLINLKAGDEIASVTSVMKNGNIVKNNNDNIEE